MKKIIIAILPLLFLSACHQEIKSSNQKVNSEIDFSTELIESGFLDYADKTNEDRLEKEIVDSFNIFNSENNKIIHIDAEELAEFNFEFFLPELKNTLLKRDFELEVQAADDYKTSHDVIINGEKVTLFTQAELESNTFWESASSHFFKKINELLEKESSDEKFYLLYSGNDLHVILLTRNQFGIISEKYMNDRSQRPYLP